jgi:hypothetical protein
MLQTQCRNAACISVCDIVQLFVHKTVQMQRDERTAGKRKLHCSVITPLQRQVWAVRVRSVTKYQCTASPYAAPILGFQRGEATLAWGFKRGQRTPLPESRKHPWDGYD